MVQAYAREVDEHKRTLLLVNKADLLPASIRFGCPIPMRFILCQIIALGVVSCLLIFPAFLSFAAERNGQNIFVLMIFSSFSGRLKLLLLPWKAKSLVLHGRMITW